MIILQLRPRPTPRPGRSLVRSCKSNKPTCWRAGRLQHHGGSVCCVFVLSVPVSSGCRHSSYVDKYHTITLRRGLKYYFLSHIGLHHTQEHGKCFRRKHLNAWLRLAQEKEDKEAINKISAIIQWGQQQTFWRCLNYCTGKKTDQKRNHNPG